MRNLEAKFPLADRAATLDRAQAIGFEYVATLVQHDTFFRVANGKLKLREQLGDAWLIHYHRHRENGLEISDYEMVAVSEPLKLRTMLSASLGVVGELDKRRSLFRRTNIRLHLDEVANHGVFGELEAVMDSGSDPATCRAELSAILVALQISPEQLIETSYFEMPR